VPDAGLAPNCCYNPDPYLQQVNGRTGDRYYGLQQNSGRVDGLFMNFVEGTSLSSAKAQILAEFPPDAHLVWFADMPTCAQGGVASPTLDKLLAGDPTQFTYVIQLDTAQPDGTFIVDPTNIDGGLIQLAGALTAAGSPGC
jgi:hypothetical protein